MCSRKARCLDAHRLGDGLLGDGHRFGKDAEGLYLIGDGNEVFRLIDYELGVVAIAALDTAFRVIAGSTPVGAPKRTWLAVVAGAADGKRAEGANCYAPGSWASFDDPTDHFVANDELLLPGWCVGATAGRFITIRSADANGDHLQ